MSAQGFIKRKEQKRLAEIQAAKDRKAAMIKLKIELDTLYSKFRMPETIIRLTIQ